MAKAPETVGETPKRKRRAIGPRGPRIATILAHVADGKPVIDVLTFTTASLELIDRFTELTNAGLNPVIVRYTMPTTAKPEDESAED